MLPSSVAAHTRRSLGRKDGAYNVERAVGCLNVHHCFPNRTGILESFGCSDGRPLRHSAGRLLVKVGVGPGNYNPIRRGGGVVWPPGWGGMGDGTGAG